MVDGILVFKSFSVLKGKVCFEITCQGENRPYMISADDARIFANELATAAFQVDAGKPYLQPCVTLTPGDGDQNAVAAA